MNGVAKQPCGEEDQQDAHHTEEDPIIEPVAKAVNEYAKRAAEQQESAIGGKSKRQGENPRLDRLTSDRRKRQHAEREAGSRATNLRRDLAPERAAVVLHPERDAGEHDDGQQIGRRLARHGERRILMLAYRRIDDNRAEERAREPPEQPPAASTARSSQLR